MKALSTLLLVPLDDNVVFPNMTVTISADVADEDRVLLVPRHDGEYAKVGTVAEVAERVRLPGGIAAANLVGLHRGVAGAAHTDSQGRLRVEVQERPDEDPPVPCAAGSIASCVEATMSAVSTRRVMKLEHAAACTA
jgi:ATP-dependent Lon protease